MRQAFVFALVLSLWGQPAAAADLAGSEWRPVMVGQTAWNEEIDAFVRFEGEGRLAGHTGCNGFFGGYRVDGEAIEIGPLASTRKACPEPLMTAETALLGALDSATGFARDGTKLALSNRACALAAFVQTDWD